MLKLVLLEHERIKLFSINSVLIAQIIVIIATISTLVLNAKLIFTYNRIVPAVMVALEVITKVLQILLHVKTV